MNKKEIYEYLKEKNIWHEITEHKAVYNMEELSEIDMPYPEADAKNLFIRDDKKKNYYIITYCVHDASCEFKGTRRRCNDRFSRISGLFPVFPVYRSRYRRMGIDNITRLLI